MIIEQIIKAESKKLGFTICGITRPQIPTHYAHYLGWIEKGFHADMNYLSKHDSVILRKNPVELWPECRSIIVLARSYSNPLEFPVPETSKGTIASYAWGKDYHNILPQILSNLVQNIMKESRVSFAFKIFSDSSPILERDFAQLAGLGWIGKNTNLISPDFGSFFFLSEIFVDVKLIPDTPFIEDLCGNCTKCLDACPTKSLKDGRILDANTCISYLTIENKGPIPLDIRNKIGKSVFGCDICQKVCPWNQKAEQISFQSREIPPGSLSIQEILEDLQLDAFDFNQKFKNSPIKRAKRRGYLRNLCVVAGNTKNPVFIPILADRMTNEIEPLIRGHAAWALGEIGTRETVSFLTRQVQIETDPYVLNEIKLSLSKLIDI